MEVPQIIAGRFEVEREIGSGGMGAVYLARHLGLERPVAIKVLKSEFVSDPDVTDRFMREARTMAKLRHPNAAMIFDAGVLPDGRHFIVMEFVEGSTLSEALAREGRFTPERAVRVAGEICDVLSEAHKLGIIHRDLKPSNIMLTEKGVCVLDFGVAKVLASTTSEVTATHATTGSGVIVGTPRYMSPEQCMGQRVGAQSDLYSLGVLVYEMLTGRPPFTDPLPSAVLVKQATAAPPPLPRLREDVPRKLALAVHTLLAKRPTDRPRDAAAARLLLERSIVVPEREVEEIQPFASMVASVTSRRSLVFRAVTPLMMIAALGLLFFVWGRSGETARPTQAETAEQTVASNESNATADSATATPAPAKPSASALLSLESARRFVESVSHHGAVSDVRVVRDGNDSAIVALHDERESGTTHLFEMERQGRSYRVSAHAPLDIPNFNGAKWSSETVDADADGCEEVLFTGTRARGDVSGFRLVLYCPRTHKTYVMRVETESHGRRLQQPRVTWSPSASERNAQNYRAALMTRARAILSGATRGG